MGAGEWGDGGVGDGGALDEGYTLPLGVRGLRESPPFFPLVQPESRCPVPALTLRAPGGASHLSSHKHLLTPPPAGKFCPLPPNEPPLAHAEGKGISICLEKK